MNKKLVKITAADLKPGDLFYRHPKPNRIEYGIFIGKKGAEVRCCTVIVEKHHVSFWSMENRELKIFNGVGYRRMAGALDQVARQMLIVGFFQSSFAWIDGKRVRNR